MGEDLCRVQQPFSSKKQKQLTTGTSLLNHSLGIAEAREDREKYLSGKQKGGADHLSGAIWVKFCNLVGIKKAGKSRPVWFVAALSRSANATCGVAVQPRPTAADRPR